MEARVVGDPFSALRSRDSIEVYGWVRSTCSGWLPVLLNVSALLVRACFLRRRQRSPRRARIRAPPTAPTITPTKAPVESPGLELYATAPAVEEAIAVWAGDVEDADVVMYILLIVA
jgi:hypothetical protein